jgi:hypothetical protein
MKLTSIALVLGALMGGLAGCGKKETKVMTLDTPQAKVTVDVNEGDAKNKIAIDGPDGKMTIESGDTALKVTGGDGKKTEMKTTNKVELAAFEGMVYPGATPEDEAGMSSMKIGEVSTVTGTFVTPDGPEKLVEHYKNLIPDAIVSSQGSMATISGKNEKGAHVSISIVGPEGPGKTKVTVAVVHAK